jgi:glycosyltransferase involved in cell wall biosynthesis
VHTYHGHVFHSYYGRVRTGIFLTIEKLLARLVTDRLVVVSEQQKEEIGREFRVGRADQIRVIRLGLDLNVFADYANRRALFRKELGIADNVTLVGIVGRLTEIKNHEMFLESVARVDLEDVRFVVIGDGSLRASLEERARSLGLEEKVIFAGGRKDPENFYPALDIVALTSRNEGTPLTLIEAMANARPVIATSVGGVVDLLGNVIEENSSYQVCERGISVRPYDVDAFAAGLETLIKDKDLQSKFGRNGFEFVDRNYRKERLLDDIKGLYGELRVAKYS